ncbi:MAG: MFS transporter [Candidatus Zixiibacteriota bacterium]
MSLLTGRVSAETGYAGSPPGSRRDDLRYIVWEGALSSIFVVLTGGAFVAGMALMLGAGDFEISLLAALPLLAQATQPLSVLLPKFAEDRRRLSVWGLTLGRQIWWLAVPLLFLKGQWELFALLVLVGMSSIATMLVTPVWLSWVSDIVPREIRGRFFGARSAMVAGSTLMFAILGSLVLDWTRDADRESLGYAVVVAIAATAAGLGSTVLSRVSEAPMPAPLLRDKTVHWARPIRDREFRRILRVFSAWNFAIGISAPFFAPHMLVNLKMSFLLIGLYSAGAAVVAVASNRSWGALIDRFGSRAVLTFCAVGIGLVPLIWLIPRAGYLWILSFEVVYAGWLWTGFNLAAFTLPIDKSPRNDRAYYLAWFAAVTGVAFFVASLLGGVLAEILSDFSLKAGRQTFLNYHILFVISALLRLASAGLMLVLTDRSEQRLPVMVQQMSYAVLRWLLMGRLIVPCPPDIMDNSKPEHKGPDDHLSRTDRTTQ